MGTKLYVVMGGGEEGYNEKDTAPGVIMENKTGIQALPPVSYTILNKWFNLSWLQLLSTCTVRKTPIAWAFKRRGMQVLWQSTHSCVYHGWDFSPSRVSVLDVIKGII